MRDKNLGVMTQFEPKSTYLYYICEFKLQEKNKAAKPVDWVAAVQQAPHHHRCRLYG
jgi:hypothetical protein